MIEEDITISHLWFFVLTGAFLMLVLVIDYWIVLIAEMFGLEIGESQCILGAQRI